jgi:hypothetical protein
MASIDARVTQLEKQLRALKRQLRRAQRDLGREVIKREKLEGEFDEFTRLFKIWAKTGSAANPASVKKWMTEVTQMLHKIDWDDLEAHYGGGGGGNPPQTPPDWPPPE